jgi:class 3 adenylate cyclase/tetratricopeptide (TPR) repeat protein
MRDVNEWLSELGLSQYEPAFRENDIDAEVVIGLTADDLRELGVASIGHRRKLLDAIAALKGIATAAPANSAPTPVVADSPAVTPDAERRQLTVMFVDLVGSTELSARLDPEDMGSVIRAYQNTVAGEILRVEGHVAKFMGDGVLAYFGWPRAHEDEAERAVRAGLSIAASVARLEGGGAPLACRIGVATGLVVVGDLVGEGAAREEAVVGDTPNLAARLQGVAAPGQLVVAEATRRLLGDLFALETLPQQTLKGLEGPAAAFAVLGERALTSRFAARQGGTLTPIVGRDQELAQLVERWRQAEAGEGQAILLTGEAGIGKSRIAEALVAAIEAGPHFLLRYQCSPYHGDSALYPAIQQISQAAGFAPGDGLERRLDRLEAVLKQGADDGGAAAAPLIAALLELDGTERYGRLTLTPHQRRSRTLAALVEQFCGLASRRPVLWLVEDAHWIDPTTLELIELALDSLAARRVLMIVTARPTFTAPIASHPAVTRLALNRLARAATQAIVTRITGGRRLPETLLEEIAARTDGVPLFVEEMTKAVVESGALRETPDAFELDGPLSALAVPATLHDSLMARLDRLHGVKEVAQTAAVIGRAFDHETLAALSTLPEPDLGDALDRLVGAELMFRRGTGREATYLFKHALVRDAAYESLLKARRATLHARLHDVLVARGDAAPEILAQHAEAAGRREAALDAWEAAGRAAVARPAFREAIADFEAAIRLCGALGSDPRWLLREQAIQVQLGQALIASQGYSAPATLMAFERATKLADTAGDPALQLPAVYGLWAGRYIATTGSADLADRFATIAATQEDNGPRLIGMRMLALENFHAGRFRASLELAEQSIALYQPEVHDDLKLRFGHDPRVAAGHYRSWCLWHLGLPEQSLRQMEQTLTWAEAVDHPNTTGLSLCFGVGLTSHWLRLPERAERAARQALRIAEEMSLALWHAWGLIHLGAALFRQGIAPGIAEIEAGLDEERRIGAARFNPIYLSFAAEAYAHTGRHAEAASAMAQAFDALTQSGDVALAADLHRVRAAIALRADTNAVDVADADLRRALEIARAQEAPSLELRAARDLAALLDGRNERSHAFDLLAPVLATFTEGYETPDLVEAKALLDALG